MANTIPSGGQANQVLTRKNGYEHYASSYILKNYVVPGETVPFGLPMNGDLSTTTNLDGYYLNMPSGRYYILRSEYEQGSPSIILRETDPSIPYDTPDHQSVTVEKLSPVDTAWEYPVSGSGCEGQTLVRGKKPFVFVLIYAKNILMAKK